MDFGMCLSQIVQFRLLKENISLWRSYIFTWIQRKNDTC